MNRQFSSGYQINNGGRKLYPVDVDRLEEALDETEGIQFRKRISAMMDRSDRLREFERKIERDRRKDQAQIVQKWKSRLAAIKSTTTQGRTYDV